MAEVENQFAPADVPEPRGVLSSLSPLLLSLLGPLGLIGGSVLTAGNLGERRRGIVGEAITEEANRAQVSVPLGAPNAIQDPNVLMAAGTRLSQNPGTRRQGAALIQRGQQIQQQNFAQQKETQRISEANRTFMLQARQGIEDDMRPITAPLRADSGQLLGILNAPQQVAGDQLTIYGYIRLITGGGGQSISDKDVARLSGSPAIDNQIRQIFDKYLSGRALTARDRNDIQEAAVVAYQQNRNLAAGEVARFRNTAQRLGIPENELFNPDIFLDDSRIATLRAPQIALAETQRREERGEEPVPEPAVAAPGEVQVLTLDELRRGVQPGG